MDKIKDSGSLAQGSIPCGFTKEKTNKAVNIVLAAFVLF